VPNHREGLHGNVSLRLKRNIGLSACPDPQSTATKHRFAGDPAGNFWHGAHFLSVGAFSCLTLCTYEHFLFWQEGVT